MGKLPRGSHQTVPSAYQQGESQVRVPEPETGILGDIRRIPYSDTTCGL